MQDLPGLNRSTLDRARISRDARFDGRFFIAVTTTRIYCRPICPSPRSKNANVRYYATAAAASAAGFRPCRRCRPEVAPGSPGWVGPSACVRRALRLIQDGALDAGTVEALATRVGIGARHLDRLFAEHVGASPVAVAQTRRLHFAKQLLDETGLRITDIAMAAGFGSLRRFNDAFLRAFEAAPRDLRRQPKRSAPGSRAESIELQLPYRPPYDWQHLSSFLSRRAVAGMERVDARGYARTLQLESGPVVVCVRPRKKGDALSLTVSGATSAALMELSTTAKRVFDVAADPARIAEVLGADPLLEPLVARRPGLRLPGVWSPFECAVRAVVGQQITVEGGRALLGRLVERAGDPIESGADGLSRLFPTPRALAAATLDEIGMPKARIFALQALAAAVRDGTVDFSAPPAEVIRALTALPGIGNWTAQYVALRALGEPDAFPSTDLIVARMMADGGEPLGLRAIEARADAWRPWRGYAVIHLWDAAGSARRKPVAVRSSLAAAPTASESAA